MSYALTITHETINEDFIQFKYEPDDKGLNRALAEVIAETWFSESCKDKKLEEIIIKGLEELFENEEEVKKSIFNSFGVKDKLKEIFYDEAIEAYFD